MTAAVLTAGCGASPGPSTTAGGADPASGRVENPDGSTPADPPSTASPASSTPASSTPASSTGASTPATSPSIPAAPVEPSYPSGLVPVSIEIPAIGVAADTIRLELSGPEPEVPEDFDQTGWYDQTRRPGEIGPAVVAGHIDSRSGPAVFARLDELAPGDEIVVTGEDGRQERFVVDRAGQYPKGDLPREVFGFDRPVPELRLITCGGSFDRSTGHYRDNYVVYAVSADRPVDG